MWSYFYCDASCAVEKLLKIIIFTIDLMYMKTNTEDTSKHCLCEEDNVILTASVYNVKK